MPLASTAISQVTTTSSMHCFLSHLLQDICACVLMHGPQLEFLVLILSTSLLSDVLRHSFMSKIADRAGALIHPLHSVLPSPHGVLALDVHWSLQISWRPWIFFCLSASSSYRSTPSRESATLWYMISVDLSLTYNIQLFSCGSAKNQTCGSRTLWARIDRDCCQWHMRTMFLPYTWTA